jgi:hypothetical protein
MCAGQCVAVMPGDVLLKLCTTEPIRLCTLSNSYGTDQQRLCTGLPHGIFTHQLLYGNVPCVAGASTITGPGNYAVTITCSAPTGTTLRTGPHSVSLIARLGSTSGCPIARNTYADIYVAPAARVEVLGPPVIVQQPLCGAAGLTTLEADFQVAASRMGTAGVQLQAAGTPGLTCAPEIGKQLE